MNLLPIGADADLVVSNALSILKAKLMSKGYREDDLQLYKLRSILAIQNNNAQFEFNFSKSAGQTLKASECYLENIDSFAFALGRLSIAKVVETAGGVPFLSAAKWETNVGAAFDATAVPNSLSEAQQLQQLFNAKMNIETLSEPALKELSTDLFLSQNNADGPGGELYGFQRFCKNIFWEGGKANQVKIQMHGDKLITGWEGAAGLKNYVSMELLGFRVKNGSKNTITTDVIEDNNCSSSNFGLI